MRARGRIVVCGAARRTVRFRNRATVNESAFLRGALREIVAHTDGFRLAVRTVPCVNQGLSSYPSSGSCLRFCLCRLLFYLLSCRFFLWILCVVAVTSALALLFLLSSVLRQSLASDVVAIPQPCRVERKSIRAAHRRGSNSPRRRAGRFFHQKAVSGHEFGQIRRAEPAVGCVSLGIAGQQFRTKRLVRCQVTSSTKREGPADKEASSICETSSQHISAKSSMLERGCRPFFSKGSMCFLSTASTRDGFPFQGVVDQCPIPLACSAV